MNYQTLRAFLAAESSETESHSLERPLTRRDCLPGGINEERPCPWTRCRYHLGIKLQGDRVIEIPNWDDGRHTCALDVADEGCHGQPEVAEILKVTPNVIRQTEVRARNRARKQIHSQRWREHVE